VKVIKNLGGEKKKMNTNNPFKKSLDGKTLRYALPLVVVIAVLLAFSVPAEAEGIGGYAGNHPLTIYDHDTINGGLVFETVTDGSLYKKLFCFFYEEELGEWLGSCNLTQTITIPACTPTVTSNCIPPGATVKMARLYNYYCWSTSDRDTLYKYGVPAEADIWFGKDAPTEKRICVHGYRDTERDSVPNPIDYGNDVIHYWDTKGLNYTNDDWDFPSGTFAWNVTDMVTGSGTYVAKIYNNDTSPTGVRAGEEIFSEKRERFVPFGFGLLVVYEHLDSPIIEYQIAEGCDYLLNRTGLETAENTTTSATFGGRCANVTDANLTTVWTHSEGGQATPPLNMMCFNCLINCSYCIDRLNPSDCCIGPSLGTNTKSIDVTYFNVTALIRPDENVLEFQDRTDDTCVRNAFLVVEGECKEQDKIPANVSITPQTLNLKSSGEWVTAHIELPEGFNVSDIDVNTTYLDCIKGTVPAVTAPEFGDGVFKFDRAAVIEYLGTYDYGEDTGNHKLAEIFVTGEVADALFKGSDTVRVIH
jgi:hypothetical protein